MRGRGWLRHAVALIAVAALWVAAGTCGYIRTERAFE